MKFFRFSAARHNTKRNWLLIKILTDDPTLYGLGDASPLRYDAEVISIMM